MASLAQLIIGLLALALAANAHSLHCGNSCADCETECYTVCQGDYDWDCTDFGSSPDYTCTCLGGDAMAVNIGKICRDLGAEASVGWLIAVIIISSIFLLLIIFSVCFRRWRRRAYYYEVTTTATVGPTVITSYQQPQASYQQAPVSYQPQPYLATAPGSTPGYATVVYN